MLQHPLIEKGRSLYKLLVTGQNLLQSPFLLVMRLYWGYHFFLTGKGKLMNLDRTTEFFASLNIPMPHFNAMMAGTTECVGGLLLLVGLGSRLATIPLTVTMLVAYATAHLDQLKTLFSKPEDFIGAEPFLFLLTSVIVMAFGPGIFSLDEVIARYVFKKNDE